MKIAFLTPEYPHAKTGSSGGIGTSIRNLAIGLLAEGCSVRVLVYGQNKSVNLQNVTNTAFTCNLLLQFVTAGTKMNSYVYEALMFALFH